MKKLVKYLKENVALSKVSTEEVKTTIKAFLFIFIALITTLLLTCKGNAQDSQVGWMFINENTIPLDKQMHFVGGAGVSAVTYAVVLDHNGGRRGNAKMWGIISSVAIGTLKEAMDSGSGGTGFDWRDIGYTVAGGIVGTYTFDILTNRAKKRQLKKLEKLKQN